MKKLLATILILSMIITFAACGSGNEHDKDPKPNNEVKHEIPTAGTDYIIGTMDDGLWIDDYVGEAFSFKMSQMFIMSPGFENLSNAMVEFNQKMYRVFEEAQAEGRLYLDENAELPKEVYPLSYETDFTVTRNDSKVFSFMESNSVFLGGPHDDYIIGGNTFDAQTGKKLAIDDVIKDRNKLAELVVAKIKTDYAEDIKNGFYDYWEASACSFLDGEYSSWCLIPEGIGILFNVDELAPYAFGPIYVEILEKDSPELFTDAYYPPNVNFEVDRVSGFENSTALYKNIVKDITDKFNDLRSYEEIAALVEAFAKAQNISDVEYTEPWSTESCGEIRIKDKENDCTLIIFFTPFVEENGEVEYNSQVYVNEMWYRNNDFCALTSYNRDVNFEVTTFQIIDYARAERISVDSAEDLASLMFN